LLFERHRFKRQGKLQTGWKIQHPYIWQRVVSRNLQQLWSNYPKDLNLHFPKEDIWMTNTWKYVHLSLLKKCKLKPQCDIVIYTRERLNNTKHYGIGTAKWNNHFVINIHMWPSNAPPRGMKTYPHKDVHTSFHRFIHSN